jgi:hypothetical protein
MPKGYLPTRNAEQQPVRQSYHECQYPTCRDVVFTHQRWKREPVIDLPRLSSLPPSVEPEADQNSPDNGEEDPHRDRTPLSAHGSLG